MPPSPEAHAGYFANWALMQPKIEAFEAKARTSIVRFIRDLEINFHEHTVDDERSNKVKRVTEAFEQIRTKSKHGSVFNKRTTYGGFDFDYPIDVYLNTDGNSCGYIYCRNPGSMNIRIAIFISDSVMQYKEHDDYSGRLKNVEGGGIPYGGVPLGGGVRVVADQVFDYYKPTLSVNATKKRALCAIFHEMGHIFHQQNEPEKFFEITNKHKVIHFGAEPQARKQEYRAEALVIHAIGMDVSYYAGYCNATFGLPEYVAEVFSGLMMGITYSDEVLEAYTALGGAMPPAGVAHTRGSRGRQELYSR